MNQTPTKAVLEEAVGEATLPVKETVELPILPAVSDTTPAPPAKNVEQTALPKPQAASLDLTMPILEVLTDPTI